MPGREIMCGALLRHVPSPEIGAGRAQENEPRKLESVIPSVSSVNTRVVTPGIGGFYVKSIIFLSIHCTLSSVSSRFSHYKCSPDERCTFSLQTLNWNCIFSCG